MARTLPPGLGPLISSQYQQPSVQIVLQDTVNRYAQLASGAAAGQTDALVTAAGTLLRAVLGQGADPNTVSIDRISSPSTAAQWTTGRAAVTSNARALGGVALCQDSNNKIWLFYFIHASNLVGYRTSTDDGATWSAETAFASQPVAQNRCHGLAAAANGTTIYLWQACANVDQTADTIQRATYTGTWSAWSNEGPSSPAWSQVRGLSVVKVGSTYWFALGVTSAYARGFSAMSFSWNGTSYTAMTYVQAVDNANLGLSASWASISYDASSLTWYACVNIVDDGTKSGLAQSRGNLYSSTDGVNWNLQTTFANSFSYGFQSVVMAGRNYIFDGAATYWNPAGPNGVDVSDDLLSLVIGEQPRQEASARLVLANLNGQYNGQANLRENARVSVSLGYAGQLVLTHLLVVDSYTYQVNAYQQQVELSLRDATKLLDYPSSRQELFSGQTVGQLVTALAGKGGLAVGTLPATAQFSQAIPCFLLSQGETLLSGLHRLSLVYGFDFWSDQTPKLRVWEKVSADPSTWNYGSEVVSLAFGRSADQANVIRVIGVDSSGNAVFQDTLDAANLLSAGKERYLQAVERLLDTAARCGIKGGILLHDQQAEAVHAELVVALNPQHELDDPITVTDGALGLSSQAVRIDQITWLIEPVTQTFEMHLSCTGV